MGMAAPTVPAFGSEQQRKFLRPLFTGERIYCLLFSKPGAGSDLAGVTTRAVRAGYGFDSAQRVRAFLYRPLERFVHRAVLVIAGRVSSSSWGSSGRRFKSCQPDQQEQAY
jgi:hypothetical protein